MTDREQDQAEALAERERTLYERAADAARRPVGEEIDPDALRQVPDVDEDGNIVDDIVIDELVPDQ